MGKPKRNKSKKVYNYDVNRKRLNRKKKQVPHITCKELKAAWDKKSSIQKNFDAMGLAANPNKTIKIAKAKEILTPMEIEGEGKEKKNQKKACPKDYVVQDLEAFANRPLLKTFSLPEPELEYVKYMIDKYGEDFKAMARDPRNHYQDTPKQLKQKVKKYFMSRSKFKNILEGVGDVEMPDSSIKTENEPEEI